MRNFFGSIANRVFVILLAGIFVAAGVTTILAERQRETVIDEMRAAHSAERVAQLVLALDDAAPSVRPVILQTAANLGVIAAIVDDTRAVGTSDGVMVTQLRARLGSERQILLQPQAQCQPRPARFPRFDWPHSNACQVILLGLTDGELLRVQLRGPASGGHPPGPPPGAPASWYLVFFLLLIALLAYLVARMTAQPIRRLADAAGALGSDLDRPPLAETGPTEIRQAAKAFNAMQARIRRQVQHRTHMLAAITHDLQTPLTRLRLRFEKVTDAELRIKLIDDLAVMQSMVREGLDLARSMDSPEPLQRLDLDSLIDSACADASDAGHDVALAGRAGMPVMAQPNALRRCLTNLLDNAIKYGKLARVTIEREHKHEHKHDHKHEHKHEHQHAHKHAQNREVEHIMVRIRDAGPGLPEDQWEAVFDPFFRLEASRSRDTGGTGLGLTIARNIAENHGGTLTLRNHPDGGLEVTLQLPVKHFA